MGIKAGEMNALLELCPRMTTEKIIKVLHHNFYFFRFKSHTNLLGAEQNWV